MIMMFDFQIKTCLDRTLLFESRIPRRLNSSLGRSISSERCSTATSGVFSAAETDSSASLENSVLSTKIDEDNSPQVQHLDPQTVRHTTGKLIKPLKSQTHTLRISKIPPPKPLRHNLVKSSADLGCNRALSEGYQYKNTAQSSRIPQMRTKAVSYVNLHCLDYKVVV